MIVQHTDKECKTKFSTGMEFTFSLKGRDICAYKSLAFNKLTW